MDAALLKTCHREVGHIIYDAKEKVTTRRISNNWNIDCQKAMDVLQKWIEEQKERSNLSVEYIVRGVDRTGNVFMTLVSGTKLEKMSKLYPKCQKMLYSAEVSSDIRPMNVSLDNEFSVINLRLKPQKRQIAESSSVPVQSQPVVQIKPEKKPLKTNLFSTVSKSSGTTKVEKTSPPPTPAVVKTEPQTATPAKVSPKKQSPKQDAKKVASGKSSISSFFSSKPAQTAASKATETKSFVKKEPESPASATSEETPTQKVSKPAVKPLAAKQEQKTRKRTITDDEKSDEEQDVIPNTPQEDKREVKKRAKKPLLLRKKASNPSKKSRIMEICDSSSDDEMDGREAAEQRKERLVDFDEEMADATVTAKQSSPSPEKPVENDSNNANRNRGKVKKLVTKTFTDEEGYLITVKDWEMVSEDESAENATAKKETTASEVKAKPALGSEGKSKSVEKKETPPTPKVKQGSIMSFFAKK